MDPNSSIHSELTIDMVQAIQDSMSLLQQIAILAFYGRFLQRFSSIY